MLIATAAVLGAFLASFFLANRLLAPFELLRRQLSRIDPGEGKPPLDLQSEADVNRVADFFASMSQKLADEKSSKENESSWLSAMLGGLTDAVLVVSGDGTVLSLNAPAEKLLGQAREALQGERLGELLAGRPSRGPARGPGPRFG